ncbi:MAG: T9SS type A sorting domain-containing protein [Rhodothermales bacterium]
MKKMLVAGASLALALLVIAGGLALSRSTQSPAVIAAQTEATPDREAEKALTKRARDTYFHMLLRDPATDAIPAQIRRRELEYARTLPVREDVPSKNGLMPLFDWREAGPSGVGGRTRALSVDAGNSSTLIAAGVTGGIWKSTDAGVSWTLRGNTEEMLGITAIAQDPRPGNRSTWYAGGGELRGSAGDNGGRAFMYGSGIYVSTDNGDTWTAGAIDLDNNPTQFDSEYDYVHRIVVSPTTGAVFLAVNGYGIWRSTNQGASFAPLIGPFGLLPIWSDIAVGADGTLVAVMSTGFSSNPTEDPGVYRSTDNGTTWSNITPAGFPTEHERSVVAIPPSNPGIAYLLTFTGTSTPSDNPFEDEEINFFKLDLTAGTAEDRSANLPDFGPPVGVMNSQFNYNMTIAVKPDDEDFVLIGGINLFRSRDGFAAPATAPIENWVGGYDINNNVSSYPNHHPDQHVIAFDPGQPNRVWVGHDGGISVTEDITVSGARVQWARRNDGYHVTQYYHVSLSPEAGDDRILGGTQDNGSPFFRYDPALNVSGAPNDLSSGDGAYAYLGATYALASSQSGRLLKYGYGSGGSLFFTAELTPPDAADQLFINPFAVDPIDETILYYPAGRTIWRYGEGAVSLTDWEQLPNLTVPAGYVVSAMAAGARSGVTALYYGASSGSNVPLLYRFDNASGATTAATALAFNEAPSGSYVHDIAVNPVDGDELLVVLSNYNIKSLYHSADGGVTFTQVEGNMDGDANQPGPSVRSASILPVNNGTVYLAGTSAGVFATETLAGNSTEWVREGASVLGHAIVSSVASRRSDGRVALGTHGRGVFVGLPQMPVPIEPIDTELSAAYVLGQNYPNPFQSGTEIAFTLPGPGRVRLSVYDVAGREVATLIGGDVRGAGSHRVAFDASSLASGSYIYTLTATPLSDSGAPPYVMSRTMTLMR